MDVVLGTQIINHYIGGFLLFDRKFVLFHLLSVPISWYKKGVRGEGNTLLEGMLDRDEDLNSVIRLVGAIENQAGTESRVMETTLSSGVMTMDRRSNLEEMTSLSIACKIENVGTSHAFSILVTYVLENAALLQ